MTGTAGSVIKTMRKAMDLSLGDLAGRSGTSAGYLSEVERGLREPSSYWLGAVERALAERLGEASA
jgi:transcriptional regulator with XRE-family HTH domain